MPVVVEQGVAKWPRRACNCGFTNRLCSAGSWLQNVSGSEWVRSQNCLCAWQCKDWHGLHESSCCYFSMYTRAVATGAAGAAMAVPHFVVLMRGQRSRRFRSRTVPRLDYRIAYTRGRSWLSNPKILATSHLSRFNRCTLPSLLGPSVRVLL